jgi:hypothetical protein
MALIDELLQGGSRVFLFGVDLGSSGGTKSALRLSGPTEGRVNLRNSSHGLIRVRAFHVARINRRHYVIVGLSTLNR